MQGLLLFKDPYCTTHAGALGATLLGPALVYKCQLLLCIEEVKTPTMATTIVQGMIHI